MTTTSSSVANGRFGAVPLAAAVLGVLVSLYGVLLVSASPFGGLWVLAIGASLALAGVVATDWAAARFALTPARQRTLALSFAALSLALLAAFVVVNYASFDAGTGSTQG